MGAFVVAYALSPIDLIPDFIPILGYVDDAILLPALIWLTVRLLPEPVLRESRAKAENWLATSSAKPRSVAGAVAMSASGGCGRLQAIFGSPVPGLESLNPMFETPPATCGG